jgi:hypothetical protein
MSQPETLSQLLYSSSTTKLVAVPTLTPANAEKGSKQAAARKWASSKLFSGGLDSEAGAGS